MLGLVIKEALQYSIKEGSYLNTELSREEAYTQAYFPEISSFTKL